MSDVRERLVALLFRQGVAWRQGVADAILAEFDVTPRRAHERRSAVTRPSPDCRDGKHRACTGEGWDADADTVVGCSCECHDKGRKP